MNRVMNLGDLTFAGVDPLSEDEFENGIWDMSRVKGYQSYYKDGKTLTPSQPLDTLDYSDDNYDYVAKDKVYRDLIADVSKELEYKEDKKKGDNKKKSRWGRKSARGPEKKEEKPANKDDEKSIPKVVTPPPLQYNLASALHAKALQDLPQLTTPNQMYSRFLQPLPPQESYLGRDPQAPQGIWAKPGTKLYVVPLGGVGTSYQVGFIFSRQR